MANPLTVLLPFRFHKTRSVLVVHQWPEPS